MELVGQIAVLGHRTPPLKDVDENTRLVVSVLCKWWRFSSNSFVSMRTCPPHAVRAWLSHHDLLGITLAPPVVEGK